MTPAAGPRTLSRRRYDRSGAIGAAVGAVAFIWLATGGTWNLFQRNLYSNFYDVQARAIFHGHLSMPATTLTVEGIREGAKTFMYYGPVPALLRMPVLLVTSRFDGRLTICSMVLAFCVAMFFVVRLGWRIRGLVTDGAVSRAEAVLTGAAMVAIGVGSPLFFLGSDPFIYHEAELWGAALALGGFDFVVGFLIRPNRRDLLLAGLFATLAILTRGSVGAGPVVALGVLGAFHSVVALRRRWSARSRPPTRPPGRPRPWLALTDPGAPTWAIGLLVAAAVPALLYVAINEAKFHTLVSLPLNHQVFTRLNRNRQVTLADNGGSLFGLKFVPTALLQYLRPDALRLSRLFPFLRFPPPATVIGSVHYDTLDFSSSLTTTMPAMVLLALVGLVAALRRPGGRRGGLNLLRVAILGAAAGTLGVLAIAFVANRYLADFAPLVVLLALAGFHLAVAAARSWSPLRRRLAIVGLALLAVFGVWVNAGLAVLYQRQLRSSVPIAMRDGFVAFQQRLDADLFGSDPPEVTRVAALPSIPGPPGSLAIVGDCVALYQSDGSEWQAVERSTAAGHFRLRVVFPVHAPGRAWPILVNGTRGSADYLTVDPLGHGQYRFTYLFEGFHQGVVEGSVFSVVPGRPYLIDAVLDGRQPQVEVHLDGAAVLGTRLARPAVPIWVGVNPLGGPATRRFPGSITRLAVGTPTCRAVVARAERDRPRAPPG